MTALERKEHNLENDNGMNSMCIYVQADDFQHLALPPRPHKERSFFNDGNISIFNLSKSNISFAEVMATGHH